MFLVAIWGCVSGTPDECSADIPCALGSTCVEGQCEAHSCATSDQCGINQYCATDNTCVSGCKSDTDCVFGDVCNLGLDACEPAQCTDTRIDCGFQEFCSPAGECYTAAGYYCADCEDDGDCGGGGNVCYGGYCAVACATNTDCPQGFNCFAFTDNSGNVVSHQCYTACWLYE